MNVPVAIIVALALFTAKVEGTKSTCCTGSSEYHNATRCSGRYQLWSSITANFSKYFMSCTKVWFLPGTYNLNGHFPIANAVNISLNGISRVTINCTNRDSFMSIYNSRFFEIHNITFINCGTSLIKVYNMSLPATTSAALLLYNVLSVTITGVVFRNSHGHGIIAYNVIGKFIVDRVYITQDPRMVVHYIYGGFVLVFNDNCSSSKKQSVLIKNSQITNIFSFPESSTYQPRKNQIYSYTESVAFGIAFHQSNYSVDVRIQDSNITNLTSYRGSHIFISNKHHANNTLKLTNVYFINNTNGHQTFSIFRVNVTIANMSHINVMKSLLLIINRCTFYHNRMVFWQLYRQDSILMVNLTMSQTKFLHNYRFNNNIKKNMVFEKLLQIIIKNCTFFSNQLINIEFNRVKRLVISGYNVFQNNTAKMFLLSASNSYPIFKGYNEFSNNTADNILSLYRYVTTQEETVINMTNNKVFSDKHKMKKDTQYFWSVIYFGTRHTLYQCPFQIMTSRAFLNHRHFINVSITVTNNINYTYAIYGTQLNSCYWCNETAYISTNNKNDLSATPGKVYKHIFKYSGNQMAFVNMEGAYFCTCNNNTEIDCFNDHITPAYPGETITINVTLLLPHSETAVHIDSSQVLNNSISPPCEVPFAKVYLVSNKCTPLVFKIVSKFSNACSLYLKLMTANKPTTLFIYYLKLKNCPLGFQHIDGSCVCHSRFLNVFPGLICDINTQLITRPVSSWIGSIKNEIFYVEYCIVQLCSAKQSSIQLISPNTQCVNNRVGVMCGQCPPGFNSVFGSLKCKKCSNFWLFLLPVFLLAGVLLILILFTLNLTVADGKINGFLLYASLLADHCRIFPARNILFVIMSLCNLDLGIETCFYHGMTEYDKTWLQFAFPFYLLCIVAILVITSKYSTVVQRLTRRRVIPVIATILLLSYNKLLMATNKALFSYKTVHGLNDNHKKVIWMWDSSLPLISAKFFLLFLAGSIVFLFVLLPLNFLLLFTKLSYRFKLVTKYLKPFLDAYQAPLKDNCRYFLGVEFITRCIVFILGNGIFDVRETLGVLTLINIAFSLYICFFKPFKTTSNTILYLSFSCNIQCVILLLTFTNFEESMFYSVSFNLLIIIALMEFIGILFYYFYISHLQKNKILAKLIPKFVIRCQRKITHYKQVQAMPLFRYEEFQDEL